jgi:hypothetical protein
VITIQNKSMDSPNESMFLQISYTIPASLFFYFQSIVHVSMAMLFKHKMILIKNEGFLIVDIC